MPTHAELASKLLSDASQFFRTIGSQNEEIKDQMEENATVFEQMSALIAQAPDGEVDGKSHSELASKLLGDAAEFFRTLAEQNEPVKEQMEENASVFEQIAERVKEDPHGVLD